MLYGAVTLAGYAAHFAPELLSVLRAAVPSVARCSKVPPHAAEVSGKLVLEAKAEECPADAPSAQCESPSKHGMRLRRREAAQSTSGANKGGSQQGASAGESQMYDVVCMSPALTCSNVLIFPHKWSPNCGTADRSVIHIGAASSLNHSDLGVATPDSDVRGCGEIV